MLFCAYFWLEFLHGHVGGRCLSMGEYARTLSDFLTTHCGHAHAHICHDNSNPFLLSVASTGNDQILWGGKCEEIGFIDLGTLIALVFLHCSQLEVRGEMQRIKAVPCKMYTVLSPHRATSEPRTYPLRAVRGIGFLVDQNTPPFFWRVECYLHRTFWVEEIV